MAEFSIYKSEFAVRAENTRLRAELDAARRDNNRLRALVGEPIIEQAAAAIATAAGEAFKAGNCTVSINGTGGTGSSQVAPVTAGPRPVRAARPAARVAVARPAVAAVRGVAMAFKMNGDQSELVAGGPGAPPMPSPAQQEEEQDPAVLRFSMLERD